MYNLLFWPFKTHILHLVLGVVNRESAKRCAVVLSDDFVLSAPEIFNWAFSQIDRKFKDFCINIIFRNFVYKIHYT